VTGASTGIGRHLVQGLAWQGATVAGMARGVDRLREVMSDVTEATGAPTLAVPADVTDRGAMAEAARRIRDELGGIDGAVFNAGIWQQVDVAAWDSAVFRRHVDTNLMGLVHGVEAVLPTMRRNRSGTIVGMASVAGYRGLPRSEAYGATKAAEIHMLESLRIDLTRLGIDVITVCPGFVRTELTGTNSLPCRGCWSRTPRRAASPTASRRQGRDHLPPAHDAAVEGGTSGACAPLGRGLVARATAVGPVIAGSLWDIRLHRR
jgi:NAD(P)-dependent dehydrogenase (short-subunit alcohol dehydrogenase family)